LGVNAISGLECHALGETAANDISDSTILKQVRDRNLSNLCTVAPD
jgi:hypothetical protein